MSVKFSDEEKLALDGEPLHVRVIYWAIRWKMDFETGIAGATPGVNLIDEEYFHEELRVKPIPGRSKNKITKYSRQEIRSAIERLEKIGVIKHFGNYVFECILAERDESAQNSSNQAATRTTTISATNKSIYKSLNKKKSIIKQQPEQQPELLASSNPYPVYIPLDTNIKINNSKPVDALSKNSTKRRAVSILNMVRNKCGKNFGADDIHMKEILRRLRDKPAVTEEDCRLVIDFMYERWGGNDEMERHFNPTTLFRKNNFYRYRDAARAGDSGSSNAEYQRYLALKARRDSNGR